MDTESNIIDINIARIYLASVGSCEWGVRLFIDEAVAFPILRLYEKAHVPSRKCYT